MWTNFIAILTNDSIQLEFPEEPTPILKLLQSPEAGFTASNNNLWWERPIDEVWVKRVTNLVGKYSDGGARLEDFRKKIEDSVTPTQGATEPSLMNEKSNLLYQIKQLQEEVAELKKFDAIALSKLSDLKLSLESASQPKAKTRTTSRASGRTKSSS